MAGAPRAPAHARRGFFLIDVLVATILLATSLAVIIGLASGAIGGQRTGQDMATAAHLADEQLHLVLARGPDQYASRFPVEGSCEQPFERFTFKLVFEGDATGGDPYVVTATVSWRTASGRRDVAIRTLIAPREGDDPDPDRKPQEAQERSQ